MSDARADEEAPAGDFGFEHFKAIHHHLFQDVYDWAGQIRTVRISKDASTFCFPENISGEARKPFAQPKTDRFLRHLSVEQFAQKSAHFLSGLKAIHAFR